MTANGVREFFKRVATDWDTMRLSYYDERVIERIATVSNLSAGMTLADVWLGFKEGQVKEFFREAGLTGYSYESPGMQWCIEATTSGEGEDIGNFALWETKRC